MSIETKTISELKGYSFFVPPYQRGYRWTEHEVTALLDDVMEFLTDGDKRYCIQPLIVMKREDGSFEVVDGQQRLTTIYIFMKIAEQEIRSAKPPFELEFGTREKSADFLKALKGDISINNENIDFYHISSAYNSIEKWLNGQPDVSVAIQLLNTKIRQSVFFIWYEMAIGSDPISMFTKVNLGKIALTNAELIKALMLSKDNFEGKDLSVEDVNKRQIEISLSWDRIEQGLQNDSLWYFLNQTEHDGTRIDMLFELLAKEQNKTLENPINLNEKLFPFLVFLVALKNSADKMEYIENLWQKVEKLYAEFFDWYDDLNKYHLIGYLIAAGVSVAEIFNLTRGKRKSKIQADLLVRARKTVGSTGIKELEKVAYGNESGSIRKILLLFNIATLVCKSEKQHRFPFNIYKGAAKGGQKWDIEHIHATADDTDEADDSLWNLTLLERGINRSPLYAAKPFNEKRQLIIEREANGLFVPLCTKNVFLKVYTKKPIDMEIWSSDDKTDYIGAICEILAQFLDGRF